MLLLQNAPQTQCLRAGMTNGECREQDCSLSATLLQSPTSALRQNLMFKNPIKCLMLARQEINLP